MLFFYYTFLLYLIYGCSSIARFNWDGKENILTYISGSIKGTCQTRKDLDIRTDHLFLLAAKNGDTDDEYGNTVLHTASKKGNIFSFFRFLDFYKYKNIPLLHQYKAIIANLEIKNNAGDTVFSVLAKEGHVLFAKVILDSLNKLASLVSVNLNHDINGILNIKNNNGLTAPSIAAISRNTNMVELLLPYHGIIENEHHSENHYRCGACPKSFRFPSRLIKHERTHTGERPYQCDKCGRCFKHNINLDVHIRTHTGERPYKCNVCDKRFVQQHHLNVHIRTHTGKRPYKCNVCGKRFVQQHHLNVHGSIHTGEKPHQCNKCDYRCITSGSLKIHKRRHTEEKPYKCKECGKGFSMKSNLKRHEKIHIKEKPSAS